MRSFWAIALAIVVVTVAALSATSLTSADAAQIDAAPVEPELYNVDLAQDRVDTLTRQISELRVELAHSLDSIDGLVVRRDYIDLNQQARNDVMQQARTEARNMAINAYVGLGPPLTGLSSLDAASANELSFRNGLLRHQAQHLRDVATTYSVLAGEVDSQVLELADSINDEIRRSEAISRALRQHVAQLPHAEWVLSIASIHHEADTALQKSGRSEPTADEWAALRFCESTETYDIDSGNTFFGAYQFTWQTWGTVGGSGNPAHAPPEEQDARARLLYARRGAQPWPVCGRYLP